MPINRSSTSIEIAALVSQALEDAGIPATLSGGGAVSAYTDNEYESVDLDFVTSERTKPIGAALEPLGFNTPDPGRRAFVHPDTQWYLEFPQGPISFGNTQISHKDAAMLQTQWGSLHIITPTHSVMDRLASYFHWRDNQSLDQALMVARHQTIEWAAVYAWAEGEGIEHTEIDRFKARVEK